MAAGSGGAAREHRLEPGDTLPGLALRYGVTMEQIKRANRLYTSDTIFLKPTLLIPAPLTPEGPCPQDQDAPTPQGGDTPSHPLPSRHDLSAAAFLQQLDAEIGRSKAAAAAAAAQQLRAGTAELHGTHNPGTGDAATSRGSRLGPRPLTRTPRAAALRDAEDEIFTL